MVVVLEISTTLIFKYPSKAHTDQLQCLMKLFQSERQEEEMCVCQRKLYLYSSLQGTNVRPLIAAAVQMPENKTQTSIL